MTGKLAQWWADHFVHRSYPVFDEEISHAVLKRLLEMPTRDLRRILLAREDGDDIIFETSGTLLGEITHGGRSRTGTRTASMTITYRARINVGMLWIRAPKKDRVVRFLRDYLDGEERLTIPDIDLFERRNPAHLLAASRILQDKKLASACEVVWGREALMRPHSRSRR